MSYTNFNLLNVDNIDAKNSWFQVITGIKFLAAATII